MFRWMSGIYFLLLAMAPGSALGEDSQIGLFTSEYADQCGADLVPYSPLSVYVIAILGSDLSALSAVEFGFENMPATGNGQITPHWNSNLVIGNISDGVAIAFPESQSGPQVLLGWIDFIAITDSWVGDNYRFSIGPAPDTGEIRLIDESFNTHTDAWGGRFTFNCNSDQDCACGRDGAATASWGAVKSLFH